jgi:SAM-dependent methyltransferase
MTVLIADSGDGGILSLVRQRVQHLLRVSGLLGVAEKVRYFVTVAKLYRKNGVFHSLNPGFKVPPRALAYDAYSAPDWDFYKTSGSETAAFLFTVAQRHLPQDVAERVLEWGCGPARVIRHIPSAFGPKTEVYGSDYNSETIQWCTKDIPEVHFSLNGLLPPLQFPDGFFDFIYSISVFTHLSETVICEWIDELGRITHSGSIVVITTNGESFLVKLLPDELESYKSQGFVVRGNVEEGKRAFSSCQSPAYLGEKLSGRFEILEFAPASFPYTGQDMWVLRKP